MDRHLAVLEKRFHSFASREENQWFFLEMTDVMGAVILLMVLFFRENVAIGRFIRNKGCSDRSLAENESRWLMEEDGAVAFISRHQRIIRFIQEKFSEQELLRARMFAQILILRGDVHYFLVSIGCGHAPSEQELTGDEGLQCRLSLRMLLAIWEVEKFKRRLEKELSVLTRSQEVKYGC